MWIVVHDHELGCCVTILDGCQGYGHSEGSDPQEIFVQTISSEPLNLS